MTKIPCPHLERLLPSMNRGYIPIYQREEFQRYLQDSEPPYVQAVHKLESELRKLNFSDYQIELILDRYVSNLTLEEMAKKYAYTNRVEMYRVLQKLTKQLQITKYPPLKNLLLTLIKEKSSE